MRRILAMVASSTTASRLCSKVTCPIFSDATAGLLRECLCLRSATPVACSSPFPRVALIRVCLAWETKSRLHFKPELVSFHGSRAMEGER